VPPFSDAETDAMIAMSKAADRPITWNTFRVTDNDPELAEARLASAVLGQRRGARIVALAYPALAEFLFTFSGSVPLISLPGWSATMRLAVAERMRALRDSRTREQLEQGARTAKGQLGNLVRWGELRVVEGFSEGTKPLAGHTVGDIAALRERPPFDTLLDLVLADELRTVFSVPPTGDDPATWRLRSRYWGDPRTLVGGSDAGAHLDTVCGARYTTDLVGHSVRDRKLLSLERAVQLITDVPARLSGLHDRGRVAEGFRADLVIFEPERIGPGPTYLRTDLPGGASRLFSESRGIEAVVVNGVEIVRGNTITGDLPGTVLRSDHLSTVTARGFEDCLD
jgi:N-acyl-D-aspartate/D-glutamate deacylase